MEERLQKADSALRSSALQNQFQAWEEQRDVLRATVSELYELHSSAFKEWWKNVSGDVRNALVLTALEDLPNNSSFSSLSTVVCPELQDEEKLLESNGSKVLELLDNLVQERENEERIFSFSTIFQNLTSTSEGSAPTTNLASAALQPMKLTRSCILLQFALAILLVFDNQSGEAV